VKKPGLTALKIAISLALLAYLLSTSNLGALLHRVRAGDPLLMLAAMALWVVVFLLQTWRWRVLLQAQGWDTSLRSLSASYLVATFFNNFLPSNVGGDVIRIRDSSRLTGSKTAAVAVVAIDRILGLGALYLLALGAFVAADPAVRNLAGAKLVLPLLGAVFLVMALLFFRPGIARRIVARTPLHSSEWAKRRFEVVQAAVHVYRERVAAVWAAFAGSVALQALVIVYYFLVARALRIDLPLAACFLMVPLCILVQTVPISFNGWGVRESVFILYFGQIGLDRDSALAFSLVGASLVVLLSLSGAVVWTSRGRPQPAEADEPE
jgi:uncharacterized protein (TIRG00374 family)